MDGQIRNVIAGRVFLGVLVGWALLSHRLYGVIPKREHLRNPDETAVLTLSNVFDRRKWTEEGLRLHRRVIAFAVASAVCVAVVYFVLDAMY